MKLDFMEQMGTKNWKQNNKMCFKKYVTDEIIIKQTIYDFPEVANTKITNFS
jgi:hypothetical protein